MAKKASTPEEKLRALYGLQVIDSRIDTIRIVRGELPLEVQDLEDELEGLETRVNKFNEEIAEIDRQIAEKKNAMAESKSLIKKYEGQQDNVRNNREYDALTKEVEFQNLEIQLSEKRIREFEVLKIQKTEVIQSSVGKLEERRADLAAKKSELNEIIAETQKEEDFLVQKSEETQKTIEERLLKAYLRIREASKNGLAVVPIDREASGGSFIKIPPQKQLDVAARKKIIVDEHSGRILVDMELAMEEMDKVEKMLQKELKKK